MSPRSLAVAAATLLFAGALPAFAGQPERGLGGQRLEVQGVDRDDSIRISVNGTVLSAQDNHDFTLRAQGMTFRVVVETRARPVVTRIRPGSRVRVSGELVTGMRINADVVQVVSPGVPGGGIPGRPSSVISGRITDLDFAGRRITVRGTRGSSTFSWNDGTEFYRDNRLVTPRSFREGDEVRIVPAGRSLIARRVVAGMDVGWRNGAIGEILSLDARQQRAEVDFDGAVVEVSLRNATIRRRGRDLSIQDLRLGQDVRVTGTERTRGQLVDASLVEIVRDQDGDGRPDIGQLWEGRITNVAPGPKTFRIALPAGRTQRIVTDEDTRFERDNRNVGFNQLREGQRVRVRGERDGDDVRARRVEILD